MKSFKVYKTAKGNYTLTEGETVVAKIKAKSYEIAKQTVKQLNKILKDNGES